MPETTDMDGRELLMTIFRKEMEDGSDRSIYYVIYRMDNWNLKVSDWPEVKGWINDAKDRIIKSLLVNMKRESDGLSSADFLTNRLLRIGVDWPELKTIKRSIDSELSINEDQSHDEQNAVRNARRLSSKLEGVRKLLNASVTLYDGEIRSMLVDAMYIMEGMKTKYADLVKPVLEHHKDTLIKSLLIMIREKGIGYWAVWEIISKLHKFSVSWPELRAIDKSIDAHNADSIHRQTSQWDQGEQVDEAMSNAFVSKMADLLYDDNPMAYREFLRKLKARNPNDRKALLFATKPAIIRWMLRMIKVGHGWAASDFMGLLTTQGVDWEEFDAIWKSLRADSKMVKENTDQDVLADSIDTMVKGFDAVRAEPESNVFPMNTLSRLQKMVHEGTVTEEDVISALNGIKPKILVYLLEEIKRPGTNWWYILHCINELHDCSVDWPELGIIRRSVTSVHGDINEDESDDGEARLAEERQEIVDNVLDAMTNGGSARTFREAKDAMQTLDRDGEDMLADEMRRQKNSIIANLIDLFFTAEHRVVDALMLLIEYSPTTIPELSRLPDSILPTVEKEFDDRSHHQGLAKTLEDVDALVENGFNRDHLMTDIREYKLAGFVRTYAINAFARTGDLGADLSAMLEMGVEKEELLPIVEKRKTTLIKAMLMSMKNRNYREVNVLLEALGEMGIEWTELAAIRKSLGSLHTLGEADDGRIHPIVDMVANKIKAAIDRDDVHGVGYAMQVLSRVNAKQVYDGLKRIAPDLVKWFDGMSKSSPSFALDELLKVTYYMDGIYPEILRALDDHKDDVLKVLLTRLRRDGNERDVLRTVKYLSDEGLEWKELDVISRSLTSIGGNQ